MMSKIAFGICLVFYITLTFSGAIDHADDVVPYAAGSTPELMEIFLGRCYEHQDCLRIDTCIPNEPSSSSCMDLWDEFYGVFGYKDACNTLEDAYDNFLGQAKPYAPRDQTLFWSGSFDAAVDVAKVSENYRVLEETLPGYILNNLVWCGDPKSQSGIDYRSCPDDCDRGETMSTFREAASREFAKQARGRVQVALNSHGDGGAFQEDSEFATIQLPNLNPTQVDIVEILLVPDVTKVEDKVFYPEELCDEGTVLQLERRIEDYGMRWECTYNPIEFWYIQCSTMKYPEDYKACDDADRISHIKLFGMITIIFIVRALSSIT